MLKHLCAHEHSLVSSEQHLGQGQLRPAFISSHTVGEMELSPGFFLSIRVNVMSAVTADATVRQDLTGHKKDSGPRCPGAFDLIQETRPSL